jgi:lysophospholipase L1-like esterase
MSKDRADRELGEVVLKKAAPPGGWSGRTLRPLLLCALFLLSLDVALRLSLPPDRRVLRDPVNPYGCFREDELARLLDARGQTQDQEKKPLDVVLLGDSVLSSTNNPPGERVEDYLQPLLRERLPGRQVRVWNLGRGGARAADLYGALRQLRAQEMAAPRGDLFVVLNTNIIFFSQRHRSPAMLFPCLADAFPEDAAVRALLKLPEGPRPLERRLTGVVTRAWFLYQQRRRINEVLFGGPPRDALRERLVYFLERLGLRPGPAAADVSDPNLPWTARGLSAEQFKSNYDIVPFPSKDAVNEALSRHLAAWLRASDVPAFVFLTPQNHGLLGALADNPGYHATNAVIAGIFQDRGVPFRSYDGLVADPLFTDLDHLTASGNRRLAELLAEDLVPRLTGLR